MKIQSIIPLFALYLVSGLNAQVYQDQYPIQGDIHSNFGQTQNSVSGNSPNGQLSEAQQPGVYTPQIKAQESDMNNQNQKPQQQSKPINKYRVNQQKENKQVGGESQPNNSNTMSQNSVTKINVSAQSPTTKQSPQIIPNSTGTPQQNPIKTPETKPNTGACSKIQPKETLNIIKVLQLINQARGQLPPLEINPILIKASILSATNKSNAKKQQSSSSKDSKSSLNQPKFNPSTECGYKGNSVVQAITSVKNEDELVKKFIRYKANIKTLKNPKFKNFGVGKIGNYWVLSFGE